MSDGLHVRLEQNLPIPLETTLHCAAGEVLALVGPSGSGKSTLLRSIAGLYQAKTGRIQCGDKLWFDSAAGINVATANRRIGMVFQHFALFPHLTALENIAEAMLHHPKQERYARAKAWLQRVHLNGLEHRLPRQLSGGQQQRVAVARALAREPEVLLLDEPFSAVDRSTRESLYQELSDLRDELKMPVILVTHDIDEATLLADRMSILDEGKILQTDTPDRLLQAPNSHKVAKLMGMRNIFSGQVLSQESSHTLINWEGTALKVSTQSAFAVGSSVTWAMPTSGVLLMPTRNRNTDTLDNVIDVEINKMWALGEQYRISVMHHANGLTMNVPRHIAQRYKLAVGQRLQVRLRGETIHLMPPQQ